MGCNTTISVCSLCFVKSTEAIIICLKNNSSLFNFSGNIKDLLINKKYPCSHCFICTTCIQNNIPDYHIWECFHQRKRNQHPVKMQDLPNSTEEPEPHSPKNNCQCKNCQENLGGLPLLAQVIENIEKPTSPESAKSVSKTEHSEQVDSCEPSTSSGQRSEFLPKSVKTMNCEHCGKSFTHRGDLNKHLRSHTGEQPYQCPVCQRRFTHTSNLARHLRIHSGDKPFHCHYCNKDFSRKDKLIMHQKTRLCMKSQTSSKN